MWQDTHYLTTGQVNVITVPFKLGGTVIYCPTADLVELNQCDSLINIVSP